MKVIISKSDIDGYRFELRKQIGVVADNYTDDEIAKQLLNDNDVVKAYIEEIVVEKD